VEIWKSTKVETYKNINKNGFQIVDALAFSD